VGDKGFFKNNFFKTFFKAISGLWCPQGVREGVLQASGGSTEGRISHGPKFGSGCVEEVGVSGAEGACWICAPSSGNHPHLAH
jgi:hypothetical protein